MFWWIICVNIEFELPLAFIVENKEINNLNKSNENIEYSYVGNYLWINGRTSPNSQPTERSPHDTIVQASGGGSEGV